MLLSKRMMLSFVVMVLCWTLGAASLWAAPPKVPATPNGEIAKHTFNSSKIFPGTTRDYWVYVPKKYNPEKPACLLVCQDGMRFEAPQVLDQLIESGEMPVTIGVFVMPGVLPAANENAVERFNRSLEYDGLGTDYVRFICDEILPEVETQKTTDGRAIKLSKDGNDRAITGASSGAICAFNAAWERPDQFSRVYSVVGTYVGLRGANEFPTLIRKVEPKPLRIYLQDGTNDLNLFAGDWWMVNQEMERAFVFAGYEVEHFWDEGAHSSKGGTEKFPDAMRFLWKDWPKAVQPGKGSPQLQEILLPGEGWQLVSEGYKFTEGPAVNAQGEVFFNDVPNSKTYKIGLDGKVTTFLDGTSNRGDGQAFGPDGRLYAVAGGTEQIVAYDAAGKATVVASGFRGNDLVVRQDGGIYVTNPGWDGKSPSQIWYIAPDGSKKVVDTWGKEAKFSNGLALSPDQTQLYVADSRSHWMYIYQVQPNGDLLYKEKYFHLHVPDTAEDSGADGLDVDRDGRVYVATRMGVQVCDPIGRVTCILPMPNGKVSNVTFGGEKLDTLFATCGDKVFKRKLKVSGTPSWGTPVKPSKPKL